MSIWPRLDLDMAMPVEAPPVSAFGLRADPAPHAGPEVTALEADTPSDDAAPPISPAARKPSGLVRVRRPVALAAALVVSLAAHATAIAWLSEYMPRDGVEAATDAVSVEIVIEAPPTIAEPVAGEEVASAEIKPVEPIEPIETPEAAPLPEMVESLPPVVEAPVASTVTEREVPDTAQTSTEPSSREMASPYENVAPSRAQETALPEPAAPAPNPTPPVLAAIDPAQPLKPVPPETVVADEDTPDLVLPETSQIPLPSARPEPQREVASVEPPARRTVRTEHQRPFQPTQAEPRAAPARRDATTARPPAAERREASRPAVRGAATAGQEAGFGRRLLAHVERNKRYPREAQQQRITGSTRLSITIDRNGSLAGARVTKGSGHAILDSEALAVARRASPYPRPPEGVGGRTISFAVTLRFSR